MKSMILRTRNKKNSRRLGGFGLYAVVFLLVGIFLAVFVLFPQFFNMQSGIHHITCREIRQQIQAAVYEHDANISQTIVDYEKPIDLDLLAERGFLAKINTCPEKGRYMFDKRNRVYCTVHSPNPEDRVDGSEEK